MIKQEYHGIIIAILGAIFIGSQGICIKLALSVDHNAIGLLIIRNAAFVIISFYFLYKQKQKRLDQQIPSHTKKDIWQAAAIGLLSYFLASLLSILSLKTIDVPTERFIFMSYPIYFLLFIGIKKIGVARSAIVIVLYLTGMNYLLGLSNTQDLDIIGSMYAVVSSMLFAAYLFFLEKKKSLIPVLLILCYGSLASFIGSVIYAFFDTSNLIQSLSNTTWVYYTLLYTVVCYLAMWLTGIATHKVGAYKVSFISALSPFFTSLFALLMLSSQFSAINFAGGCLLVLAVLLANLKKKEPI